jgi:alkanesulfonate monooxygenase SsuD/methylene tetrahydromethanopterin reductase-like flavin-dependent oxidoreductase (luciferase family)
VRAHQASTTPEATERVRGAGHGIDLLASAVRSDGFELRRSRRLTAPVQHAIFLPPFGPLAEPSAMIEIGIAAEEHGWDGLFLWDHVVRPVGGEWPVADPWVVLAAVAATTTRIRLGPMVTPLSRRRIAKLARETVTLDRLSRGRLTFGVGSGGDSGGEFTRLGEELDPRRRGELLDDGLTLLTRYWAGDPVGPDADHTLTMLPGPAQHPRIPIWCGVKRDAAQPARRAARYDGIVPVDVGPDEVRTLLDIVRAERGHLEGFDVALISAPGAEIASPAALGATWTLHGLWPGATPVQVLQLLAEGC